VGFRDRFRPLALLTVFLLMLVACGGDSAATTGADGATTTTGAEAGGDQIELLVWVSRPYYIPPDEFASFTAENPNVTVRFDVQSNDDMLQQMLRMQDAGQPLPDILGAEDSFLIENFAEAGLLLPHNPIAAQWQEEDPASYDLLLPLAWDETTIDGEKYGLSVTANFDILYYNTVWFEEAGVTTPFESLDDVLDAMRAMKTARPDSIPFTVQARAGDGVTTLKTMLAAAGTPFNRRTAPARSHRLG
jgi:ABC-type glycerol-3-phosphate transport system substrate-binding protein